MQTKPYQIKNGKNRTLLADPAKLPASFLILDNVILSGMETVPYRLVIAPWQTWHDRKNVKWHHPRYRDATEHQPVPDRWHLAWMLVPAMGEDAQGRLLGDIPHPEEAYVSPDEGKPFLAIGHAGTFNGATPTLGDAEYLGGMVRKVMPYMQPIAVHFPPKANQWRVLSTHVQVPFVPPANVAADKVAVTSSTGWSRQPFARMDVEATYIIPQRKDGLGLADLWAAFEARDGFDAPPQYFAILHEGHSQYDNRYPRREPAPKMANVDNIDPADFAVELTAWVRQYQKGRKCKWGTPAERKAAKKAAADRFRGYAKRRPIGGDKADADDRKLPVESSPFDLDEAATQEAVD